MKEVRAVNKLTICGKFLTEYKTIKEASIKNQISMASITNCCRGRQKTAANFKWEYNNKYLAEKFNQKNIELLNTMQIFEI